MKEAISKGYILYNSIYMPQLKKQTVGMEAQSMVVMGLEEERTDGQPLGNFYNDGMALYCTQLMCI